MKKIFSSAIALLLVAIMLIPAVPIQFIGSLSVNAATADYKHVVIIGVDGAGAFFQNADTPNIDAIFEEGAVTQRMLTSNPTISAQCWGSLLHGVTPEYHRLTNAIAGSTAYPSNSEFPSIFRVVRESKPDAVLASFSHWAPINSGIIEDSIGVHKVSGLSDKALTASICDYVSSNSPDLLFVQFDEADGAGHTYGYNTEKQWEKLTELDGYIGDIYEAYEKKGIIDDTLFIVTADHGGNGTSHGGLNDAEKYVMLAATGKTVQSGTIGDVEIRDLSAIAAYALGVKNASGWTARVPSGLFKGVEAGERPVYVTSPVDRDHDTVPTPVKGDKGYIGNYISEDRINTYLTFDGDITDSMGGSTSNEGKLYFTEGYFGQAVSVDDGYVTLPEHDPDKNSFTVSFWIKTNGVVGDPAIFGNENWVRGTNPGYLLAIDSKQMIFNIGNGSGRLKSTYPLPSDFFTGWAHVLVTVDREENVVGFAYDFGSMSYTAFPEALKDSSLNSDLLFNIGQDGTGTYSRKFSGLIDEYIVFDGAFTEEDLKKLSSYYKGIVATPEEGSADHISNFIDNKLINYLPFDGNTEDRTKAETSAVGNLSYANGYFGEAISLGSGYVSIPDYDPGTDSFTVSFWMNTPGVDSDPAIFSNSNWASGKNPGCILAINSSGNTLFNFGDGSNRFRQYYVLPTDYANNWVHVTLVVDRENAKVKLAYNFGSFVVTDIPDSLKNVSLSTDYPLNIGQDGRGQYSATYKGLIDEFMIFDGALDRNEVLSLAEYYGLRESTVSVPTPEKGGDGYVDNFVTDKALISYLPFDGNAEDTNGKITSENGKITYTDGVFGQGAVLDDGYVSLPHDTVGAESFTVSLWVQTMGVYDTGGWIDPALFSNADWAKGVGVGVTFALRPTVLGRVNIGSGSVRTQLANIEMPSTYSKGWVHCLLVVDREKKEIRLSYDFGAFNTVKIADEFDGLSLDSGLPFNIGQDGTGAYGHKIQASVDEFMIFEGAFDRWDVNALAEYYGMSAEEVPDHRTHGSVPTPELDSSSSFNDYMSDNELLLYLPMDGSAEPAIGDLGVTENGSVTYTDGFYGQGASFDNGYMSVESFNPGTGSFTVALWMKTDGVVYDPILFATKDWQSGRNPGFALSLNNLHQLDFNAGYGSNKRFDWEILLPADYQAGWTHVVFTVDRENKLVRISCDFGAFVEIDISEIGDASFDGLGVFNIGQDATGAYARNLTATLDEFMVFGNAFDQADVDALAAYYGIDKESGHISSKTWDGDAIHHWKNCENGCDEKLNYAEHIYTDDRDTDCNECGYVREVEIPTEGEVSRKIFWAFEDGVLTVTGRGKIKNFSAGITPWSHLADKITKVVIGEGITYIGSSAFYCCANIESVELPESLTAMGNYVFYGCSSLKAITIPEAVTEIGKYSFRRSGLETIDFAIGYGWSAGEKEFSIADIISGGHRFISKSYYKQTWVRNTEAAVETLDPNYVAGGIMHTDVIWELTDIGNGNLKLTIRGNGAMADYGTAGAPWYAYWEQITEIEIQEGVTTVGRCAFYGLKFVRTATVADSVTAIGDYGFYMCRLMKEITLPDNVTSIGKDAFVKTGLSEIPTV